jgi:aspartyl protease family protein
MKFQILAWFGGIFALTFFLSPLLTELDRQGNVEQPDVSLQAVTTNQPTAEDWYAGETILQREADGHFYANASLDGMDVRFMVDTGASIIALTGDDAMAMGLQWDDAQVRQIGHGANGPVYGVATRISRVELGQFSANNVQAAIIPEGLRVSLLGQSFLSKIGKVEIRDNQMVFAASS